MIVLMAADPKCISRSEFPISIGDQDAIQHVARDTLAYFRPQDASTSGPARIRAFSNAGHTMIEISQSFKLPVPEETAPLTVLTSTLIAQTGKYWVLWEFAAGNAENLQEMRNTKVFLDDVAAPKVPISTPLLLSTPQ